MISITGWSLPLSQICQSVTVPRSWSWDAIPTHHKPCSSASPRLSVKQITKSGYATLDTNKHNNENQSFPAGAVFCPTSSPTSQLINALVIGISIPPLLSRFSLSTLFTPWFWHFPGFPQSSNQALLIPFSLFFLFLFHSSLDIVRGRERNPRHG